MRLSCGEILEELKGREDEALYKFILREEGKYVHVYDPLSDVSRQQVQKIIAEERLPDAITVDFSAGKSLRFSNGAFLRINLNAGNILNNTNFRTGGFEQLRFDYETKDVSKFPPRYFYSYGTNFNLNVAYIFPR